MKTKINTSVEWHYFPGHVTLTFIDYSGDIPIAYCRAQNTEKGARIAETKFHNKIARKIAPNDK